MEKEEKNLLLALAAIGVVFLLTRKSSLTSKGDETDGLGKLPPEYIKVGRINMNVARKAHIKAGDIVMSPNYMDHIRKEHGEQLAKLGISAIDFISVIVKKFTQIRRGSDNSILLVVNTLGKSIVLALQLKSEIDDAHVVWNIHTSYIVSKFTKKNEILWER